MMKQKRKIINQINPAYLISQLAVLLIVTYVFKLLKIPNYWLLSISIYFLLSGYLKIMIPKSHRRGLYYLRKGEFEGAIYAFSKSYKFFSKHSCIDEYRAYVMLSISRLSYREMALMNIIYAYQKLGKMTEARKVQNNLAKEFPNNPYGKN